MTQTTYITTSWDDGHPRDLRVAELLAKHNLVGTFYVPLITDKETMATAQVRDLSSDFEIGAHTLHHVILSRASQPLAWQEISNSKAWVEDTTGKRCQMFCPPEGKYRKIHLDMVLKAGYVGLRSVELMSLDFPRTMSGVMVLPTTVQSYPLGPLAIGKNALKRMAIANMWRFVTRGRSTEWPVLARALLVDALKRGGVFHLWGHSWELEDTSQWHRLDEVFRFMGEFRCQAECLTNSQICEKKPPPLTPIG
jgi:peptidoglycan/xylan/chitin deacetylase (PgdA/CDA1 family)